MSSLFSRLHGAAANDLLDLAQPPLPVSRLPPPQQLPSTLSSVRESKPVNFQIPAAVWKKPTTSEHQIVDKTNPKMTPSEFLLWEGRLQLFANKYLPEHKRSMVPTIARQNEHDPEALMMGLVQKYGPEPSEGSTSDSVLPSPLTGGQPTQLELTPTPAPVDPDHNVEVLEHWCGPPKNPENTGGKKDESSSQTELKLSENESRGNDCNSHISKPTQENLGEGSQMKEAQRSGFMDEPRSPSATSPLTESFASGTMSPISVPCDVLLDEHQLPVASLRRSGYHRRILAIYDHYCTPIKAYNSVSVAFARYSGRERSLLAALIQKYGPEPPLPQSPIVLALAQSFLQVHAGRYAAVMAELVAELGPEPATEAVAVATTVGARRIAMSLPSEDEIRTGSQNEYLPAAMHSKWQENVVQKSGGLSQDLVVSSYGWPARFTRFIARYLDNILQVSVNTLCSNKSQAMNYDETLEQRLVSLTISELKKGAMDEKRSGARSGMSAHGRSRQSRVHIARAVGECIPLLRSLARCITPRSSFPEEKPKNSPPLWRKPRQTYTGAYNSSFASAMASDVHSQYELPRDFDISQVAGRQSLASRLMDPNAEYYPVPTITRDDAVLKMCDSAPSQQAAPKQLLPSKVRGFSDVLANSSGDSGQFLCVFRALMSKVDKPFDFSWVEVKVPMPNANRTDCPFTLSPLQYRTPEPATTRRQTVSLSAVVFSEPHRQDMACQHPCATVVAIAAKFADGASIFMESTLLVIDENNSEQVAHRFLSTMKESVRISSDLFSSGQDDEGAQLRLHDLTCSSKPFDAPNLRLRWMAFKGAAFYLRCFRVQHRIDNEHLSCSLECDGCALDASLLWDLAEASMGSDSNCIDAEHLKFRIHYPFRHALPESKSLVESVSVEATQRLFRDPKPSHSQFSDPVEQPIKHQKMQADDMDYASSRIEPAVNASEEDVDISRQSPYVYAASQFPNPLDEPTKLQTMQSGSTKNIKHATSTIEPAIPSNEEGGEISRQSPYVYGARKKQQRTQPPPDGNIQMEFMQTDQCHATRRYTEQRPGEAKSNLTYFEYASDCVESDGPTTLTKKIIPGSGVKGRRQCPPTEARSCPSSPSSGIPPMWIEDIETDSCSDVDFIGQ